MAASGRDRIHQLPGNPPIEVVLRRSARAKRFSLSVNRSDGRARLSMPHWAPEGEALAFLEARSDWLRKHVSAAPTAARPVIGAQLPVLGIDRPVALGAGRSARFDNGRILVPDGPGTAPRIKALLTNMARDTLSQAVTQHAKTLGRPYGSLTLRDTKSRWGSCSSKGDLMFSWRLIMAPPEVLDYVAAHEVAHLAEMNHSARFWAICHELCPETPDYRRWLRENGPSLMRWRFDAA